MKYNLKITRKSIEELDLLQHHELELTSVNKSNYVDLRSKFPPVFEQGELGSCTANALCAIITYNIKDFIGSRLFLYYNERKLENDIPDDSGAELTDGIKSLQMYGICPETDWIYDISKFAIKPPDKCYTDAAVHKAIQVKNLSNDITMMKNTLLSGYPFVVGINVFESFESEYVAKTGNVPMPHHNENKLGGHAIVICGYDDIKKIWIARNSWGSNWGDNGYFYLPYLYLVDSSLSSDLWTIYKMS
jgi:C1A family cysteine protease